MHGTPLVTVLLVTYNSAADLDACLSGVQRQNVPGGHEVVVIDNASSDDSAERVKAWAETVSDTIDVQIVCNPTNVGYAAANNQAVELARGRVLLLLNPDAAMDDGCIQQLVAHLEANPGVGAASALLRNPDGSVQQFARRELTIASVFCDLTEAGRRIDERWRGGRGRRQRRYADEFDTLSDTPRAVDCPAAACVALWRELAQPQLFDERFPLFFNDGELFHRLRAKHYRCEVLPWVGCVHGYGTSHGSVNTARKRAEFVTSMRRYSEARRPMRWTAVVNILLVLDVFYCLLMSFTRRNRRLRAVARGTLGGLGLPGGAVPWLSRQPDLRQRLRMWRSRWRGARITAGRGRERNRHRRVVIRRIRHQARRVRASVDIDIARTAELPTDLRVELGRRQHSRLVIGEDAIISSGVLFVLRGGTLRIGAGAQVRHDATLTVRGELDLGDRAAVSRGAILHVDGLMRLGFGAAVAERVTMVDTHHAFDDVPTMIHEKPVTQADITLEPCAFVGASSVVTAGVTVGRSAVVAALSVVSKDVPPRTIVAGIPAKPIRELDRVLPPLTQHEQAPTTPRKSTKVRNPQA